jgi:hypothetical protein
MRSADNKAPRLRDESASSEAREEIFGWMKSVGGGRKLRFVGQARNRAWAFIMAAAYNLVRMGNLSPRVA